MGSRRDGIDVSCLPGLPGGGIGTSCLLGQAWPRHPCPSAAEARSAVVIAVGRSRLVAGARKLVKTGRQPTVMRQSEWVISWSGWSGR